MKLGILFAAAFVVRLVMLLQLGGTPFGDERLLILDALYYDTRGREIAGGQLGLTAPGLLSPLYCYLLGFIYSIAGADIFWAKLAQCLIGAWSCVLVAAIGRRLFDERVGLIAGGLLAAYGAHIYYTGLLLPPTIVTFLSLALVWVLVGGFSMWRAALAGVVIGLAVLAKANAILLLPVLAVAMLWQHKKPAGVALMAACCLATLAPITLANHRLTGEWFLVTTTGGSNLLKGNGPTATGTHAFLPVGTQATGIRKHLEGSVDPVAAIEQSRKLGRQAWRHMFDHPGRAVGLFVKKFLLLFNAHEPTIRDRPDAVRPFVWWLRLPWLPFWLVVPLGLAGVALSWSDWRRFLVPWSVLLVQVASFVLVFVLARYRLVLVALLLPFAAHALVTLVRGPRVRALAATAVFAVLAFLPVPHPSTAAGVADQYRFIGDRYADIGLRDVAASYYVRALENEWQDPRTAEQKRAQTAERLMAIQKPQNPAGASPSPSSTGSPESSR